MNTLKGRIRDSEDSMQRGFVIESQELGGSRGVVGRDGGYIWHRKRNAVNVAGEVGQYIIYVGRSHFGKACLNGT